MNFRPPLYYGKSKGLALLFVAFMIIVSIVLFLSLVIFCIKSDIGTFKTELQGHNRVELVFNDFIQNIYMILSLISFVLFILTIFLYYKGIFAFKIFFMISGFLTILVVPDLFIFFTYIPLYVTLIVYIFTSKRIEDILLYSKTVRNTFIYGNKYEQQEAKIMIFFDLIQQRGFKIIDWIEYYQRIIKKANLKRVYNNYVIYVQPNKSPGIETLINTDLENNNTQTSIETMQNNIDYSAIRRKEIPGDY